MASKLDEMAAFCIVENGEGCLLRLLDISSCLQKDSLWSWEKEEFPEIPSVAASEWRENE